MAMCNVFRAVDKNPAACFCTRQTLGINGLASCTDTVIMDLVSGEASKIFLGII